MSLPTEELAKKKVAEEHSKAQIDSDDYQFRMITLNRSKNPGGVVAGPTESDAFNFEDFYDLNKGLSIINIFA